MSGESGAGEGTVRMLAEHILIGKPLFHVARGHQQLSEALRHSQLSTLFSFTFALKIHAVTGSLALARTLPSCHVRKTRAQGKHHVEDQL